MCFNQSNICIGGNNMRFLPFIDGKSFLVLYALYVILVLIYAVRILKNKDGHFIASTLSEEKYYVMKYHYNVQHMFYYFTYRLYAKGVLLKDEKDNKFYVNKDIKIQLSALEEQICYLYLNKFSPKDFKPKMIKESDFREYYYNIYNQLVCEGLIKSNNIKLKGKLIVFYYMMILIIPGIWRWIGGAASGMPVGSLVSEIVIILFISLTVLYQYIRERLTNEGRASKEAYENYRMSLAKDMDETNNNTLGNDYMNDFLITNSWMLFLGVSSIGTDRNIAHMNNDNNSGSSCSSCSSSNDSGSSCSSCSSCGGCGGGD